jgi:hypothetical protein
MKSWALAVAGLYVLILAVLTVPAIILAGLPKVKPGEAVEVFIHWQFWLWLAVMALGQLALLLVPVRVASRRPVTKSALWPALLACGLMAGGLVTGAAYSILEFLGRDQIKPDWLVLLPIGLGIWMWGLWAVIFNDVGTGEPRSYVARQCELLFKGSILELLVAVPTHIVARYRDYCCAGFMTFVGLTMGISVMLFSFGPAVFFLYMARWQRMHPLAQTQVAAETKHGGRER